MSNIWNPRDKAQHLQLGVEAKIHTAWAAVNFNDDTFPWLDFCIGIEWHDGLSVYFLNSSSSIPPFSFIPKETDHTFSTLFPKVSITCGACSVTS
jgi:hypothetical protein